jgi:Short C-terminal domain
MEPGGGIPGWFIAWGVLVAIVGIGATVWRVSTAQKLAKRSGMDPGLATKMTLLSDDGLDATYLAASLRGQATPPPETPPTTATASPGATAERLEELKSLLDGGLVTQAEYDERRKAIIDSV